MADDTTDILTFHCEKTTNFQTLHADGVFSSQTPSGNGFLAFYVERTPLPKRIDYVIGTDGSVQNARISEGKEGIFREIHTGLTLSKAGLVELKERVEELLAEMEDDNDE